MSEILSRPQLLALARAQGFADVGVAGIAVPEDEAWMLAWLERGHHGEMDYMARHGLKRSRPELLQAGNAERDQRCAWTTGLRRRVLRTKCWRMPVSAMCPATRSGATITR